MLQLRKAISRKLNRNVYKPLGESTPLTFIRNTLLRTSDGKQYRRKEGQSKNKVNAKKTGRNFKKLRTSAHLFTTDPTCANAGTMSSYEQAKNVNVTHGYKS